MGADPMVKKSFIFGMPFSWSHELELESDMFSPTR